ncbi:MAG: C25 family cysteine peptidase, partial [Candidatus Bathyarchaeia archaeon]
MLCPKKSAKKILLSCFLGALFTITLAGAVKATTSYDLLIIGPESYRSSIEPFIDFKLKRAVDARFVSVESISTNLQAEELHGFIAKEYWQSHIKFVLLIGTLEQVPTKYVYSPSFEEFADFNYKPTDWYYGVPEWKDSEIGFLNGNIPKIAVGRLPVRNDEELRITLSKIISVETHVTTGNFIVYNDVDSTFEKQLDVSYASYNRGVTQTPQPLTTLLNKAAYAITITHGSVSALHTKTINNEWETLLSINDITNINRRYNIHYIIACFTGALDLGNQSLAQTLITSPTGPALVIASSRTEVSNTPIAEHFWKAFFNNGDVGISFLEALQSYISDASIFSSNEPKFDKYNLYLTKTLYGDPSWSLNSPQKVLTPSTSTEMISLNRTQEQVLTLNYGTLLNLMLPHLTI